MGEAEDGMLDQLLEFVRVTRGFDFTGYKRASIERRVRKRMSDLGIEGIEEYIDRLELHGDEFARLFDTLLINVTGFFRDPEVWSQLANTVIPKLTASRTRRRPLRVWCAGCATGEEAYTIAMILADAIGLDEVHGQVKIYATDADEAALEVARHGVYGARQIEHLSAEVRDRFFEPDGSEFAFRKDLRRAVIFGRNDLIQDAPISRIDLLACRNTLMYFTAETQAQILRRFHFALNGDGVLVLGRSEMPISRSELFTPVDLRDRLYRKVPEPVAPERVRLLTPRPANGSSTAVGANLRDSAFDHGAGAQIVVDAERTLAMANVAARRLFQLGPSDLGRPLQDLELSYRPLELRGHLDALERDPRTIVIERVRWPEDELMRVFSVQIAPLSDGRTRLGTAVTFQDQTQLSDLQDELVTTRRELEATGEELQSTVEELETTNEELQSTNEELETTNEELQSTNEELETMNEELQSTNEELETMNEELRRRSSELNGMNAFLDTILSTLGLALAVLDRHRRVQIWNREAEELWGISSAQASDCEWSTLDIGLPVAQIAAHVDDCLSGRVERIEEIYDAINRRGRALRCQTTCLPLADQDEERIGGAIVLMEPLENEVPEPARLREA